MEIQIKDLQKKILLNPAQIKRLTKIILNELKIKDYQLSLVFVTGQKIRALNKKYLNRTESTDVLAFDFINRALVSTHSTRSIQSALMGDVVISTDAVLRNSQTYQTLPAQELMLYVVHGILHLTGYDDHKEQDIHKMRAKEGELMDLLSKRVNKTITEKT